MKINNDFNLTNYNTFGINCVAKQFVEVNAINELIELIKSNLFKLNKFYILGGGSNILFKTNFDGIILHPTFTGIEVKTENDSSVIIKVYAGEKWDNFVKYCVEHNYEGLENLSFIPGSCGAAPVQNIGAFGVEIKDVLQSVEIINLHTGEVKMLKNTECSFGYRTSVFKNDYKQNWLIVSANYKLKKKDFDFKLSYGNINNELKKFKTINLENIRRAVIDIRTNKLPNPEEIGNAGSFFKNPIVPVEIANNLKKDFPDIPIYEIDKINVKIAAGWLIENCGWKGITKNNCGVHHKQALVLVNYGNSTGQDIIDLSEEIKKSVFAKFNILIETEVNII